MFLESEISTYQCITNAGCSPSEGQKRENRNLLPWNESTIKSVGFIALETES